MGKIMYKDHEYSGSNDKVDYVVEQGTDGIWQYRKWNSGIAECWGYKLTSGAFSAWGNGYSHDIPVEDYPSNLFTDWPYHYASSRCTGGNTVASENSIGGSITQTTGITHYRATALSGNVNFQTFYYARGRWK